MRLARVVVVLAPLAALTLAGCAADGSTEENPADQPATVATQRPAADPGQRALQFAQCMREHGVDMPDPDPNNPGQIQLGSDPGKVREAAEACRAFSPIGGETSGGTETPQQHEARLKFARCMREHGVEDWPDPSGSPSGPVMTAPEATTDPDFEAAAQACAPLLREAFGDTF